VRVALGQVEPALGDVPENTRRTREVLDRARSEGADLVVLPELMLTG